VTRNLLVSYGIMSDAVQMANLDDGKQSWQVVLDLIMPITKHNHCGIAHHRDRVGTERYPQSLGRDPLICPYCHEERGVWKVWHPKHGVVYDELEAIKKGRYGSAEKRAYV
jgi:hypothetical protein